MSEESYQRNVLRGVTGPETGTCLLASFDRLSPHTAIRPQTYDAYDRLRHAYVEAGCEASGITVSDVSSQMKRLMATAIRELGVPTQKNVVRTRAKNADQLDMKLQKLARGGFRTCVYLDVGGLHAVGVEEVSEGIYDTKSTWTPIRSQATVEDIFAYLDQSPRLRSRPNAHHTTPIINIFALPPEPRR